MKGGRSDLGNALMIERVNSAINHLVNAVIANLVNVIIADLVYARFIVHSSRFLFTFIASQCDMFFPVNVALPLVMAFAHSFEPSHSQGQVFFQQSGKAIASHDAST